MEITACPAPVSPAPALPELIITPASPVPPPSPPGPPQQHPDFLSPPRRVRSSSRLGRLAGNTLHRVRTIPRDSPAPTIPSTAALLGTGHTLGPLIPRRLPQGHITVCRPSQHPAPCCRLPDGTALADGRLLLPPASGVPLDVSSGAVSAGPVRLFELIKLHGEREEYYRTSTREYEEMKPGMEEEIAVFAAESERRGPQAEVFRRSMEAEVGQLRRRMQWMEGRLEVARVEWVEVRKSLDEEAGRWREEGEVEAGEAERLEMQAAEGGAGLLAGQWKAGNVGGSEAESPKV